MAKNGKPQDMAKLRALLKHYKATVSYAVEKITPEMALEWMAGHASLDDRPRGLVTKVAAYGRGMSLTGWHLNGDAIVFDEDGKLVDGVARLLACIESGCEFATIVFRGVPREAAMTLGSHLRRTSSDILDINGEASSRALSHAWPVVVAYLNAPQRHAYVKPQQQPVSASEMVALGDRYPQMAESAAFVKACGAGLVLGEGLAAAAHFFMTLDSPEKADAFMRVVGDPAIGEGSAPATLAQRINNLRRTAQTFRLALIAKAWNRYRVGSTIGANGLVYAGRLEVRNEAGTQEAFPTFQGVPADFRIDLTGIGEVLDAAGPLDANALVDAEHQPVLDIMIVTPDMCRDFLTRNGPVGTGRNRRVRATHVSGLARDLDHDRWILNAQPMKFGRSGRLIDGQHRCHAGIESGRSFITFVVRNLDDSVFSTYDGGERKSLKAHFQESGLQNTTALAATAATLHRILTNTSGSITVGEGFQILAEHPSLSYFVNKASTKGLRGKLAVSVGATLYYLFDKRSTPEADRFFDDLALGAGLEATDPMLRLRNTLMIEPNKSPYPLPEQRAKISILTWNARRRKRPLTRYVLEKQGYPTIV